MVGRPDEAVGSGGKMTDQLWGRSPTSSPILAWAMLVGGISFFAGFIGPVLLSDSNLGPLLGIFVTGPLGFLVGALIGILISARRNAPRLAMLEVRWLGGAWLGAMLFTLAASTVGIGWFSIGAQLSVLACAATLFYSSPSQLPEAVRKTRAFILLGAGLVLATSIFPPVISARGTGPRFALFLDQRFDASTRVPEYTVDQTNLLLSWLIIATTILLLAFVRRSSAPPRRS